MFLSLSSITLFRWYLNYFRLLGTYPVTFNRSDKPDSKTLILISLLHIVLVTLVVIIVYVYSEHIFYNDDSFGQFNDALLYAVVLIAYYAIIIESYLKRETQSKIWHLIAQCHHQSERIDDIDQWKLWNSKEFNSYFIGSYIHSSIHSQPSKVFHLFSSKDTLCCLSLSNVIDCRLLWRPIKHSIIGHCT